MDEHETDVLVGIRADIGAPLAKAPDQGVIIFSVDCTASASPEFEGRGAEEVNVLLECVLSQMLLGNGAIDLQQLCIQKGQLHIGHPHMESTLNDSPKQIGRLFQRGHNWTPLVHHLSCSGVELFTISGITLDAVG